ncbi:hypothetical protein BpHYR1_001062 [Brachionus plicatilis]|uniref:Uncharacterized protein n=1 Tax=Brachionus plicatilis TaxID=10195 RepID=A0A3M7RRX2_BRAPC|nr:hypothetical protein BpHYR1_001062 [Brachionus plicatilis]
MSTYTKLDFNSCFQILGLWFLLKGIIRRNEAIYCLIGFGIGIGCCLVYKWFRTTMFTFSYIDTKPLTESQNNTLNKKDNENDLLLVNCDKKRIRSSFSDSVFKRKKSPKTKRVDKASNLSVKINFSQGFGFNLIKYLNRLSFKNSKYKRPLCRLKQFQKSDHESPIRDDFFSAKISSLDPTSNFDSTKNVDKTDKNSDLEKKLLNFGLKKSSENLCRNGDINNSFLDFSNCLTVKEENKNDSLFGDDDDLFEVQTDLSKKNFNFDIENLSEFLSKFQFFWLTILPPKNILSSKNIYFFFNLYYSGSNKIVTPIGRPARPRPFCRPGAACLVGQVVRLYRPCRPKCYAMSASFIDHAGLVGQSVRPCRLFRPASKQVKVLTCT